MFLMSTVFPALLGSIMAFITEATCHCNTAALNTTSFNYVNNVENQPVYEIAKRFNRGICDIGRANLMVDVSVVPHIGQTIIILGQVCNPDWTSCIIDGPGTTDCLVGGPRLYYTLNGGDSCNTNITCIDGICPGGGGSQYSANETIPAGQFIKIPMCSPSTCDIEPYTFSKGVFKDLADKYGSTVGQLQMLSPTYNYNYIANEGGTYPPIGLAKNCRLLSSNYTVLS
ncbi:hypothetical protein N7462_008115 [Penicillium macrosclerotiorum]|uniref:uncharacterized protein n=1 Tax=Penicillium macrosclerotiorum TaxID=303699 RepID=UPI002548CE49|nr:uncharacterized protein N7462_008115 [Penicillium macrosclerotiorum]KAJ5679871.1 hypothetical protein N7462_008115 [Penicillium macrosclerotiorum]